ncbi:MAG TPA: hypothetical protein VGC35_00480, partial [Allosphingosinicella sp.]
PLRKSPDLVEVSTDGIAPLEGDESRVVLLSGWRGQPFHLGWQRIVSKLEASGAAQSSTPAPAPAVRQTAAAAAETRADAGSTRRDETPARRRFAIPAIAAAVLLAVAGAAAWIGDGPRQAAEPGRPAAPIAAPLPAAEPLPSPAPQPAGAITAGETALEGSEPVTATTGSPGNPPRTSTSAKAATTAAGRTRAGPPPATRARAPVPPVVKRYSKKRSKLMRKFCERSGRNTLECRIFARSTRAAQR